MTGARPWRAQASHYRRHRQSPAPVRAPVQRKPQPRTLSGAERAQVRAVLNSAEHVDKAPAAVYHELLDDGTYLWQVNRARLEVLARTYRELGLSPDRAVSRARVAYAAILGLLQLAQTDPVAPDPAALTEEATAVFLSL